MYDVHNAMEFKWTKWEWASDIIIRTKCAIHKIHRINYAWWYLCLLKIQTKKTAHSSELHCSSRHFIHTQKLIAVAHELSNHLNVIFLVCDILCVPKVYLFFSNARIWYIAKPKLLINSCTFVYHFMFFFVQFKKHDRQLFRTQFSVWRNSQV